LFERYRRHEEAVAALALEADPHGVAHLVSQCGSAPRHATPRALAELEAQIPAAEASRDRWLKVVETLTATGRSCRGEKAMLRSGERRLELLRRSRELLLSEAAADRAERPPGERS
jgi:hypothetical protein